MLLFYDNPYDLTSTTAIERGWMNGNASLGFGAGIVSTDAPRARAKWFSSSTNGVPWVKTPGNDGGPVPSGAKFIIGMRYRCPAFGDHYICAVLQGGNWQGYLARNVDGTISWYRGEFHSGSAVLVAGPSIYALNTNTNYYIELELTIDDATGTVDVYIDGINRLSASGLDTKATASASWNQFTLPGGFFNNGNQYCTDVYVCDGQDGTAASPAQAQAFNTPLGDVKVEYLGAEAGNATYTDWVCSTGTDRGAMVDDGSAGPDDDSTYVFSDTPGDKVSFTLEDLPITTLDVLAVMPVASMTKNDAGSRVVKPLHRISGVDYYGTPIEAPAQGSYRFLVEVMTKSPATGVAWTPSEVNGMEGGVAVHA